MNALLLWQGDFKRAKITFWNNALTTLQHKAVENAEAIAADPPHGAYTQPSPPPPSPPVGWSMQVGVIQGYIFREAACSYTPMVLSLSLTSQGTFTNGVPFTVTAGPSESPTAELPGNRLNCPFTVSPCWDAT